MIKSTAQASSSVYGPHSPFLPSLAMLSRCHIPSRPDCPYLPVVGDPLRPSDIRELRKKGGHAAFTALLSCAQSLWLQGLPAQALLQLNHTLALDPLPLVSAARCPAIPYQAKVWMFQHCGADEFIGNPVRHYQHLATRVSGPNRTLRSWRAWACFHLAQMTLPVADFPCDQRQIEKENLQLPGWGEVVEALQRRGHMNECDGLQALVKKIILSRGGQTAD